MSAPSPWLPSSLLATWFGAGLLPWAPGTWGSLAALPFGWALFRFTGPLGLAVATVAVFVIGLWAAQGYERVAAVKDPGAIVIDEVAGQWLTIIAAGLVPNGLTVPGLLLAFLSFRIFDVAKPWPVSWADRHLKGAFGVMVDDIIAGIYAAALVYGVLWAWEFVLGERL
ncbi:MAG: phosphatidylglycerophosphatase A [Kiloniellaceae bacterium]